MTLTEARPSLVVRNLLASTVVWDNHACMPLRPEDPSFLPQLARHRAAGVDVVSLNVTFDIYPPETAFLMLAAFRSWIAANSAHYTLVESAADIRAAKRAGKLAVVFDIEGGCAVEPHIGLVEVFYRLGVRWMLIAYNTNNRLGGGCQDDDCGLTDFGRRVIDEMERVGMVLCCSHTGYRTALEAMDYARKPVILSHSNARALHDHPRNVPDELLRACAGTGGVVGLNGIGPFLGDNDNSTEAFVRQIDYVCELIGPRHVGLGLDYVFDHVEMDELILSRPDIYPPEKGYVAPTHMVEPERIAQIAEALIGRGYAEGDIRGILGENHMRIAEQVWR